MLRVRSSQKAGGSAQFHLGIGLCSEYNTGTDGCGRLDVLSLRRGVGLLLSRYSGVVVVLSAVLAGCSADWYTERADAQAYDIIAETQQQELGRGSDVSVEPPPAATQELEELTPLAPESELREALGGPGSSADIPAGDETGPGTAPAPTAPVDPEVDQGPASTDGAPDKFTLLEERGEAVPVPEEARVLRLSDVLYLAFRHNRDYLSRKESLYLEALSLTLEQYTWTPRFRAALSGNVERSGDSDRASLWDAGADVGMSLQLPDGGDLDLSMSSDFDGDFGSRTTESADTTWSASLVQPLLRGFGRSIAQESLVQSERDVVYAVREFERYRRTFAVNIASEFFNVLRQVDTVRNAWENYQSSQRSEARAVALAAAGRTPLFEADQASQRTLSARNSWVRAVQTYELDLDSFKITLGLPTDLPLVLDSRELDRLREKETLQPPEISQEEAIEIAVANRLDLMVERDQVADAQRQVHISKDQLRGDLDLTASVSIGSKPTGEVLDAQFHEGTYRLGVDYDLPVDRFSERNSYRRAIISLEQSRRNYSRSEDEVKLDVRDAYRQVQENIATYVIDRKSLDLAQERVNSVTLLLEAGRAEIRDLLEAQDDLVDAQNALTQTVVDLFIARLRLVQEMGRLRVNDVGMWEDRASSVELTPETNHE